MIIKAQRAQRDHKVSTKTTPSHPYQLIERGSQTASHRKLGYHDSYTFCKGSIMYPRLVISSLAKRLEKPPFHHSYTSFGVWPRDHYMSLQSSTTGLCHALVWFPKQTVPACSSMVSHTNVPSCTKWFRWFTKSDTKYVVFLHSTEQDTLL
jgi:hypothetical protein